MSPYIQQIAGYLIIYRLAEGRAWNRGTLANGSKLQTLQFRGATTATSGFDLETPMDGVPLGMPFKHHHSRVEGPIVVSKSSKEEMQLDALPGLG